MPKKVITEQVAQEMVQMSERFTAKQIADRMKLQYSTVHLHLSKRGIRCKLGKIPSGKYTRSARAKTAEGMFNVSERENWLV